MQLLDDGNTPQAQENAVAALARLAHDSPDAQTQIAKKLVTLLSVGGEGAKSRSAHMLGDLASTSAGAPVRIVNAGAISPLVALASSPSASSETQGEAALALSCLAKDDTSNQLAIATGLVALLGLEPDAAKEALDAVMKTFAEASDLRAAIATAAAKTPDATEAKKKAVKKTTRKVKSARVNGNDAWLKERREAAKSARAAALRIATGAPDTSLDVNAAKMLAPAALAPPPASSNRSSKRKAIKGGISKDGAPLSTRSTPKSTPRSTPRKEGGALSNRKSKEKVFLAAAPAVEAPQVPQDEQPSGDSAASEEMLATIEE